MTSTRSGDLAAMALRALGRVVLALLVAFHAWLLWTHLVGGRALDLQTSLRWLVAAGVLVGFRALQRRGIPLFWGKRAVVLWLLVVLIHCQGVWNGQPASMEVGIPEAGETAAHLLAPLAALATLLLFSAAGGRLACLGTTRNDTRTVVFIPGTLSSGFSLRFLPRPPPIA